MNFLLGLFIGCSVFEPILINYIYMSNVALFNDLILNKKNREKLRDFYISQNRS